MLEEIVTTGSEDEETMTEMMDRAVNCKLASLFEGHLHTYEYPPERMAQLLDLPWEDVLVARILPLLSLADCFRLRRCSSACRQLLDIYFVRMKIISLKNVSYFPRPCFEVLLQCRKLQYVNFINAQFLENDLCIKLFKNNPNIVSLNLSHTKTVTDRCIQPVLLNCKLKELKLASCSWLTVGTIDTLICHQSSLEVVDFSFCTYIYERCLILFLQRFVSLHTIYFRNISEVTDKCLLAMAASNQQLKYLNVIRCHRVTDKGISAIADNCPQLKSLRVQSCLKVTEKSLGKLRTKIKIDRNILDCRFIQYLNRYDSDIRNQLFIRH